MPSFRYTRSRTLPTVLGARNARSAICRLLKPARGEVGDLALRPGQLRWSVWPAPDATKLLPRAIDPNGRAQILEGRECRVQGLIGESLLLPTAVQLALGQQRPCALERHRQAFVCE